MKRKRAGWVLLLAVMIFVVGCSNKAEVTSADSDKPPVKIIIAEPVHNLGYLPLYVAIEKGYFEQLNVEITTLAGGGAHTNAVLTDRAWAFIGGPEHNAFAKAKGADLRAIVNVVNRGNVYLVTRPDIKVEGKVEDFVKGKTIITTAYGGTPNSITRFLLSEWGLDPDKDVVLREVDTPAVLAALKEKQGDIAITSEPQLTLGIKEGIWGEPFYNVPQELGPYAYSTINVKLSSIENDPETARKFVEGMKKGSAFVRDNKEESLEIAQKEFPTMDSEVIKATLERAYADELWEFSGEISEPSVELNLKVVRNVGMLKEDIKFEQIIDTQFIK